MEGFFVRIIKKIFLALGILLLSFVCIVTIRTVTFKSKQIKNVKQVEMVNLNDNQIVNHLSQAIQFKTVSYTDASNLITVNSAN